MNVTALRVEPLTAAAFAPFGNVIETAGNAFHYINAKMVERYHDLAQVDVDKRGGRVGISVCVGTPYVFPLRVAEMERHPLSSQCFIPLSDRPFLVIVAVAGDTVEPGQLRGFLSNGAQGVNYAPGVWHHALLTVGEVSNFVVVDRVGGEGPNCDVVVFEADQQLMVDAKLS